MFIPTAWCWSPSRCGSLQSAAFTFLMPAGCVYDPPERARTGQLHLRNRACVGRRPRDGRQFILDLDNLGVERSESVSNAHASYSGATVAENLPRRPGHLCRPAPPAASAGRAVGVVPAGGLAGTSRGRRRAGGEGDDRASPAALSDALGPTVARRAGGRWNRPPSDDIRPFFRRASCPNGTILGVAGRIDWEPLRDLVGRLLGDWGRASRRQSSKSRPGPMPAHPLRIESDADRHRLRQRALSASGLLSGLGRRRRARAAA